MDEATRTTVPDLPPTPEGTPPDVPGYRLIRRLGIGGMAEVWAAEQLSLERPVALKLMDPALAEHPRFKQRFEREARAMAGLSHPGILILHERGEADGRLFYAMELVEGASLRDFLREKGRLGWEVAAELCLQVAEALVYLHDLGVVHRDLKPENVLVDGEGRVKLADFGLASLADFRLSQARLTATNTALGTPMYMSPEQATDAARVDFRSDLYSFGVMFYELLTGDLPMGGWEPASVKVPGVPTGADTIVDSCLAPRPENRYDSTGLLVEALQALREGREPDAAERETSQDLVSVAGLDLDPDIGDSSESLSLVAPGVAAPESGGVTLPRPSLPPKLPRQPDPVMHVPRSRPSEQALAPPTQVTVDELLGQDPGGPSRRGPLSRLLRAGLAVAVLLVLTGVGLERAGKLGAVEHRLRYGAAMLLSTLGLGGGAVEIPDLDAADKRELRDALFSDDPRRVKGVLALEASGKRLKSRVLGVALARAENPGVAWILVRHLAARSEDDGMVDRVLRAHLEQGGLAADAAREALEARTRR